MLNFPTTAGGPTWQTHKHTNKQTKKQTGEQMNEQNKQKNKYRNSNRQMRKCFVPTQGNEKSLMKFAAVSAKR